MSVSIHAPTRGATRNWAVYLLVPCCFNPRTHTGCDPLPKAGNKGVNWFQSTHPHGVRPEITLRALSREEVSIHAPTRGATQQQNQWNIDQWFQSTHPHGVRLLTKHGVAQCIVVSIHAPTRGATKAMETTVNSVLFQSTHPHGVRHICGRKDGTTHLVSIHAPTRGATYSPSC